RNQYGISPAPQGEGQLAVKGRGELPTIQWAEAVYEVQQLHLADGNSQKAIL
ncbi:unnamed protein product, partial [marine sediment metagenome]